MPLLTTAPARRVCLLSAAAVIALPVLILAQSVSPSFTAGRLARELEAPVIDGRVTDSVWQGVTPYTNFTQQDPDEGAPATEKTEVRMMVGADRVFIGVICFDRDPSKIIVSQSRRDASLTETDAVVIILDTFNDNQNAFVFGTNPLGIEYDGQVAREGQSSGLSSGGSGGSSTQRGGISAFNPNWDGDWVVKAGITERGWEAEIAIPLKTLRYAPGANQTWGFNVMRNIRHKNEQVYLAAIPRGFDIFRVSLAAKVSGLNLPQRRDVKLIPYALGSVNIDYTRTGNQTDKVGDVGADLKWGIRPNLTLDATVNTDFAQVEADEEQVNLTRFDLFFPEKRPFFLENASTFQVGQPQNIDLFFSRRVGLSAAGVPNKIVAGGRLSGKIEGWNVGLLNIQTDVAENAAGTAVVGPANNFGVARVQREIGRSSVGAIVVNRQGTGAHAAAEDWNRAFGLDANVQLSANQRVSAFVARTDSPGATGSDYAGRVFYNFTNPLWQVSGGYSQVGSDFNPEVGFLPRRGYRNPEFRVFYQPQPKNSTWIRRYAPHMQYAAYYGFDGQLQTSRAHIHPFEIQPKRGGRIGIAVNQERDNPTSPFVVFKRDGRQVVIPTGSYTWWQPYVEYIHDPSARVSGFFRYKIGSYYDGDFQSEEMNTDLRITERMTASLGWIHQDVKLPSGAFTNDLVPFKASYSFTTLASLSALVQYNSQTALFSSNIRLALLDRSGTGLFIVYNDRRDVLSSTAQETLGRSFIVKYARLVDFF